MSCSARPGAAGGPQRHGGEFGKDLQPGGQPEEPAASGWFDGLQSMLVARSAADLQQAMLANAAARSARRRPAVGLKGERYQVSFPNGGYLVLRPKNVALVDGSAASAQAPPAAQATLEDVPADVAAASPAAQAAVVGHPACPSCGFWLAKRRPGQGAGCACCRGELCPSRGSWALWCEGCNAATCSTCANLAPRDPRAVTPEALREQRARARPTQAATPPRRGERLRQSTRRALGAAAPDRSVPTPVRRRRQAAVVTPPMAPATLEAAGAATHAFTVQGVHLALAMVTRHKLVENRSFRLQLGWFALHAGKRCDTEHGLKAEEMYPQLLSISEAQDHLGHIVGLVRISEYRLPEQCSDHFWALGPLCNVISHAIRLRRPIRATGQQGIWRIQPDAQAKLLHQLRGGGCEVLSYDLSRLGPRPTDAITQPLRRKRRPKEPAAAAGRGRADGSPRSHACKAPRLAAAQAAQAVEAASAEAAPAAAQQPAARSEAAAQQPPARSEAAAAQEAGQSVPPPLRAVAEERQRAW